MWHAVGIISQEFLCPIAECCLTSGEIKILSSVEHPSERAGELRVSSHSLNCSRIFWVLKCKWHNPTPHVWAVLRRLLGEKLDIEAPGVGGWWRSESAQHSVTQKPSQVIRSSGTQSTDTNFLQGFYFNLQFFIFDLQRQERGERWHKSHQDIICNTFNIQLFKHTNKYSVKGECSLTIFAVSLVQSTFAVDW